MFKNYDSTTEGTQSSAEAGSTQVSFTGLAARWIFSIFLLLILGTTSTATAQSIVNYGFSYTNSGTLEDLSSGATAIMTGNNDTATSTVHPIGFDFWFMGVRYTHFSANSNGQMKLHTSSGAATIGSGTFLTYSVGTPILAPMAGDNEVNDGIRFKLIGIAPNRTLVVEWNEFYTGWSFNLTNAGNMQSWLHETSGKIEYAYGEIYNSNTGVLARPIYIAASNTATTAGHITIGAVPTFTPAAAPVANSIAAGSGTTTGAPLIANLGSASDGNRWIYTFTPSVPVAPTALNFTAVTGGSMTLNWTDNSSNETGFAIYRSSDNINFDLVTTTAANAVSYNAGGLSVETDYYWRVIAVNEIVSGPATGMQSTDEGTLTGSLTVGFGGDYENLTQAFTDINTKGLAGNVNLELIAGYPAAPETYPIVSSAATSVGAFTVKVYPTVPGLSITGNNAAGTLNINGGANIIIDGRVNEAGPMDLIISNTNVGASPAITFNNDAHNNIIRYCSVRSTNNSTTSGTIVFGTTTAANGNDNNTISNCDIRDGAATPVNGIYSAGTTTTAAHYNDNNTISNCNIYNFFSAGSATNGILVAAGNAGWTITGNSLYQTASRIYTTANTHTGINVSNSSAGSGYNISGNSIGGSAASAGGSAYTMGGTVATLFRGITLNAGTASASNVQGNTVANISHTTASASGVPGIFAGINISAGLVNVGTVSGNTIGATSGINSIVVTSTVTGGTISGIYATSSALLDIRNNNVAAISTAGGTGIGYIFHGIHAAGSSAGRIMSNNTIGSATANSITVGSVGTTVACTFNGIYEAGTPTTLTMNNNIVRGAAMFSAINAFMALRAGTTQYTIDGNQVFGHTVSSSTAAITASTMYGFYNLSTPTAETFTNNQIHDMSMSVNSTAASNILGGVYTWTAAGVKTWSNNQIYNLTLLNSNTGSSFVYGIRSNSSSPNIFKNKIYDLTNNSANGVVYGIAMDGGTTSNLYNNIIGNLYAPSSSLTAPAVSVAGLQLIAGTTINVYHNTIAISGSGGANFGTAAINALAAPATITLRNNIFSNTAAPSGTGKSVAYQRASAVLTNYGASSNNNLFYAGTPGANNLLFFDGTNSDQTMGALQARVTPRDVSSVSETVPFVSTNGSDGVFLHIDLTTPTLIEGGAAGIETVTDDFDGDIRNATTPDIGADEFSGTAASVVAINSVMISPTGSLCAAASRNVTANITAGGADIISITLNYAFNGVAQTPITMTGGTLTANSTSDFSATIPAASPANASVTWSISATDPTITKNSAGTAYQDDPLLGAVASAVASVNPLCVGSSTVLTAVLALASGPPTIGTGSSLTSATSQPTAFCNRWPSYRMQIVYTAAELQAAGLAAGNITAIAFNIATLGDSANNANFVVQMGSTALTTLTTFASTAGFTMVHPSQTYVHSASGWQTIPFANPYNWNGSSNIIIDMVHSGANSINNSQTYYTATTGNTVAYTATSSTDGASLSTNRLNTRFTGASAISSVSWSDGSGTFSGNNVSVSPTVNTTYTPTIMAKGCEIVGTPVEVVVNSVPSAPTTTPSTQCGAGAPSASASSTSGLPTPSFVWYAASSGGPALQTSTSTTYTTSIDETTTLYVAEINGTCESGRTAVTITVAAPPEIVITPTAESTFCGTGGSGELTASSEDDPAMTYEWSIVGGDGTIDSDVSGVLNYTVAETTIFRVTGTPVANPACEPIEKDFTISVFALPQATLISDVNGVCAGGGSATLSSNLNAGNFSSSSIPHAALTPPVDAITLTHNGVGTPPPTTYAGNTFSPYDDGGWGGIQMGFNFSFFGTTYNTINVGTNGTLQFGAFNANSGSTLPYGLSDFSFTTLPSATEPFNLVAVLAMDNDLKDADGGTIKYWTEGSTPNRKFVVAYINAKEYADTKYSNAQAIFYETTGVVEVHVTSSTNSDRNKLIGINNGNGTIGALAYQSGTVSPITTPIAFRFSPPVNYTTVWSESTTPPYDISSFTPIQSGTNIFSKVVNPSVTTRYALSYTNQTTGCTNAELSSVVTINILSNVAPATTAISNVSTICLGGSANLSVTGNVNSIGNTEGITYQWQVSVTDGASWDDIDGATLATLTVNPIQASSYRVMVSVCGGTPVASSSVALDYANAVTDTTPGARCGAGSVELAAESNVGSTISWFENASGGVALASGPIFNTPVIEETTTYYAAAIGGLSTAQLGPASPSVGTYGSSFTGSYEIFNVTSTVVLQSVNIFPTAAGSVVVQLLNSSGTVLQTAPTYNVTGPQATTTISPVFVGAPVTVPVNFTIPPGTGYRLNLGAASTAALVRNDGGAAATYGPIEGVTITGNSNGVVGYFYNFYNWVLETSCASERVAVLATINEAPDFALSASAGTICPGAPTATVTIAEGAGSYDDYSWFPDTDRTGDEISGWQFSPSVTTTYTLTALDTENECQSIAVFTVTIEDPAITSTIASPTTVCNNGVSTLTATLPAALYSLEGSAGSYTPLVGGNTVAAIGDDFAEGNLPIGFSFPYNGTTHTVFAASSNGFIELSSMASYTSNAGAGWTPSTNSLAGRANIIAPLWDDNNTTGGSITYLMTGSAPDRILTVQWTNMHVGGGGSAASPTISVQAILHENGEIEFVYGPQGASITAAGASVGMSFAVGQYNSITPNPIVANSTITSSPENTGFNGVGLTAGNRLTLSPPAFMAVTWSPMTDLYLDLAATLPYSGEVTRRVYAKPAATTTYTATATSPMECTDTMDVTVTNNSINIANITGGANEYCLGQDGILDFDTATPGVTWTSSNPLVATVNSSGVVTPLTVGSTIIGATITNSGCTTVAANPQTVVFSNQVVINTQPASQIVQENADPSFTVAATGTTLTYQWQENSGSGYADIVDGGMYAGATTATLSLTDVQNANDGNLYRVIVSGVGVCADVTSEGALLTIGEIAINSHPADQNICEVGTGTASFSVSGSGEIDTYEWEFNIGSGIVWTTLSDDSVYSGTDTATLSLQNLTTAYDGFRYRAVLTGGAGSATSNFATLSVDETIVVTQEPVNADVCHSGGSAGFSAAASGDVDSLQWQYSANGSTGWGNVVNNTPLGVTYSGNTTGTLNVTTTASTPLAGTYFYRLMFNADNCADVPSAAAQMIIYRPSVTSPGAQNFCAGELTDPISLTGTPVGVTFNISGGAAIGLANQTGVTEIPSFVAIAGSVTITLTPIANGCTGQATTFTVNVNALPGTPTVGPSAPVCEGTPLTLTSSTVNIPGYSMNPNSGVSFIDIAATGTSVGTVGDDTEHNLTIPSFTFNGVAYTTARVGMNGVMALGSAAGEVTHLNVALPTTAVGAGNIFLAPYWDDLDINMGGTIRTQTIGNVYIVQYTAADHNLFTTGNITFQIQLNLTTGAVSYVYQDVTFGSAVYDGGLTATIGLQLNSTTAMQYSLNTASLVDGQSITFTPSSASYEWSGPNGFSSTQQNPLVTNTASEDNAGEYTLVVTNNATGCETVVFRTIAITPNVSGGDLSNQSICGGTVPADLELTGYTGTIVKWQKSSDMAFTSPVDIVNDTDILTGAQVGAVVTTTYIRAVLQGCSTVYSDVATITAASTVWTGGAWSNGVPNSNVGAVISDNFISSGGGSGDFSACTLTVTGSAVATITSGDDLTITGAVTVNEGASLTFANNANLLQDVATVVNNNSGDVNSIRNAMMIRQDYVYWSSPVDGQNLRDFSLLTLANRFYTIDAVTGAFVGAQPDTNDFDAAVGYAIRAPNNYLPANSANNASTPPQLFVGQFTGTPHNGDYTVDVTHDGTGFNLIGNPYPSPVSADALLTAYPGTLYFWAHMNQTQGGGANYASYNKLGAAAAIATASASDPQSVVPNGTIQTGQGFLFRAGAPGTTEVTFTNAMRTGNNNGQFFRSTAVEKHRIWMNLENSSNRLNQMLVGYVEEATQGIDAAFDGELNYAGSSISSALEGGQYVIQGRSLPFVNTDIVPLNFKAEAAGQYTLSIDHVDGLFSEGQDIFLKDNLAGVTHNIKQTAYTFTTEPGTFAERFQIVYQNTTLDIEDPTFDANSIVVFKQNNVLQINSGTVVMSNVKIFDIRGRLVYEKDGINANTASLNDLKAEQQVLLVQITSDNNRMVTKKVVY